MTTVPVESRENIRQPNRFPFELTSDSRAHWVLVVLFFFALTIVQTWPLSVHLGDHIMGWAPDSYQVMWNLWWLKHQVLSLHNPFHTSQLFYPQGSDLYMHTITPVNGALSIPAQVATGNVLLSWNLLSIAFFTASGVGAYALAYHVCRNPWASLIGGLTFAFSPFVMTHINGHLNISTTWPIPIFVLALLNLEETRRIRFAVLAGVMLSVMTWNWLEFAIDSGLFLVLFALFWGAIYLRRQEHSEALAMIKRFAIIGFIWLPLSLPILIPSVHEVSSGDIQMRGGLSPPTENYSADLLGYFTPSPLWGPGEVSNGDYGGPAAIGGVEGTVFLGILPVLLAAVALLRCWRTERRTTVLFWGGIFAFFFVMALGPFLHIDGNKSLNIGFTHVTATLPYRFYQHIPLIGLRRAPARMVMYATLALAVLAPLGVTAIANGIRSRSVVLARAVPLVALALALLEIWNPPVGLASYNLPSIYQAIGNEQGNFTILDLPVGRITGTSQRGDIVGGGMADYAQITTGKASIGGYFSRGVEKDVAWLREQPGIKYLSCPVCPGYPDTDDNNSELVLTELRQLDVKYLIVNLKTFEGQPTSYITDGTADAVKNYIQKVLALPKVSEGDGWSAYSVSGVN